MFYSMDNSHDFPSKTHVLDARKGMFECARSKVAIHIFTGTCE